MTVTPAKLSRGRFDFGEVVWSDGFHRVRTPLVVRVTNLPDDGVKVVQAANATGDGSQAAA